MGKIVAVCKSNQKGMKKDVVAKGIFKADYGLVGDAHADPQTHRQVSLLSVKSINKMQSLGVNVGYGDFAENITTEGIDLVYLPIGARLLVGDEVILEVTQIGKECHTGCAIFRQIGKCIMPKEGIFARVIQGGFIRAGDTIKAITRGKRMKEETKRIPILQVSELETSRIEGTVVREFSLTILLNNHELVTLLCSPKNLRYLVAGFLVSEGLINGKGDIKKILIDNQRGVVHVETPENKGFSSEILLKHLLASSGGRGASPSSTANAKGKTRVASKIQISRHEVFAMMDEFVHRSELYKATEGVHSAALCDTTGILLFADDIGRHNAIDKIFGQCLLEDIPTTDRIIFTSGRISSEILLKVAKRNIPVIISKSAPTDLGVRLADDLGVTLLGFVRGRRMNVYTHRRRIAVNGKRG